MMLHAITQALWCLTAMTGMSTGSTSDGDRATPLIDTAAVGKPALGNHPVPVMPAMGGVFAIPWFTIDGGGGTSEGDGFMLTGSIGQHDAGAMAGNGFEVAGGFKAAESIDAAPPCPADLNGTGTVDVQDLLLLLGSWGFCPAPCAADFDGTGAVDVQDLLIMLGAWGECPG